jgi:regulator of protease activity HflC (stomatin/prohibitin superfamily)
MSNAVGALAGPVIVIVAIVFFSLLSAVVKIAREYERGIIFRLGRLLRAKGPGVILLIPMVDRMIKIDLRVVTLDVPRQEMMTRDNVPVTVDAVVYFRVVNPEDAVVKVENFSKATYLVAQTTLRSILGQHELDELLSQRDRINQQLQQVIDVQTEPWGIKVTLVEVRDVILPDTMKRAMAKQAEMERERRAKIINAEGEFQAAEKLVLAAAKIATQPVALQLRYLQALTEVATEHNSTTIFPIPIDLLAPFLKKADERKA